MLWALAWLYDLDEPALAIPAESGEDDEGRSTRSASVVARASEGREGGLDDKKGVLWGLVERGRGRAEAMPSLLWRGGRAAPWRVASDPGDAKRDANSAQALSWAYTGVWERSRGESQNSKSAIASPSNARPRAKSVPRPAVCTAPT